MTRALRCTARDESGFGLVELLVTMMVLAVVSGAIATTVVSAMSNQRRQMQQADVVTQAKIGFDRMTRDLRQANPVLVAEPGVIEVRRLHDGEDRTTRYEIVPGAGGRDQVQTTVTIIPASGPTTTSQSTALREVVNDPDPSAGERMFRYFDEDDVELGTALAPVQVDLVRRIEIDVRMGLMDSPRTVDLTTSVTLRNVRS